MEGAEEPQLWHYLNAEGGQQGPVTADDLQALAAQGTIHPETEVWTEGLDQWVPATHVEGLLPEAPHGPHLVTGSVAPRAAAHPVGPAYEVPTAATSEAVGNAEDGNYPVTTTKRASFGKLLFLQLSGILMTVGGPLLATALAASHAKTSDELPVAAAAIGLIGYVGGTILLVAALIVALVYLHRAWAALVWGRPQATPGKAIGFLFIPLFNLYWIFIAHWGLARDWNRIMASYPDLARAPRISPGVALACCICAISGIGAPAALVLWFVHYAQICKGINFMATRSMYGVRSSGIHLY